jgi:hypothetical protein
MTVPELVEWAALLGYPAPFSFFFFYFPQLPTLFPPGKGPFASLARVSIFYHFYLLPLSPPTALGGSAFYTRIKQTKDPWSAVHGLFNTSFHFITSPTNRKQLSPPNALGETALPCYLFFWIHRFRGD